jgi:hypothetical protein
MPSADVLRALNDAEIDDVSGAAPIRSYPPDPIIRFFPPEPGRG